MKTLLVIIMLFITIQLNAQYGYLIVTKSSGDKYKVIKTENIELVKSVCKNRTGQDIDFIKLFSGQNKFIEYRTTKSYFYCEKKLITITKKGKIKYKKYGKINR